MSRPKMIALAGLAAAAAALPLGCTTVVLPPPDAAGGSSSSVYTNGKLTAAEPLPIDQVWAATQAAVSDLRFNVQESANDALSARLIATEVDGTTVKIYLTRQGPALTQISVRAGFFGDEAQARFVYDKIRSHLTGAASAPPQPTPPPPPPSGQIQAPPPVK